MQVIPDSDDNPSAAGPRSGDEVGRLSHEHLRREYLGAALLNPRHEIDTPADLAHVVPMVELFARALNDPVRGEALQCACVRALTTSPQGVQVLTWLAGEHADRHWKTRLIAQEVERARFGAGLPGQLART